MASVQLKNVVKKYPNGFVAVKDFNLDGGRIGRHQLRRPFHRRKENE